MRQSLPVTRGDVETLQYAFWQAAGFDQLEVLIVSATLQQLLRVIKAVNGSEH